MADKKILIVDDEINFVKMVQVRLEANGYDVEVAFDGEEGLEKAAEVNPDLILLDIMMPKKDGYTFLLELKKNDEMKGIPVIALTAKPGMKDMFELEGAKDYITKPFESDQLLAKIRDLIG